MSSFTNITAEGATPALGPYSHAVKTPFAIFLSGAIHADKDGNLVTGTIQEKTAACIANIKAVLAASGSSLDKVVKTTVFLADLNDFTAMNEEYAKAFSHKPARSCVQVAALPKGADVEIEVVALY